MHTRGIPSEWRSLPALELEEVVPLVLTGLEAAVATAETEGIVRDRIAIDPGFGFGKRLQENYPLLRDLSALHRLRLPIMVGASRKSFLAIAETTSKSEVQDRLSATLAAHTAAILAGAHILRVHDVRPAVEAAAVADRLVARA